MYKSASFLLLFFCINCFSFGQVKPVKDINILPGSANPTNYTISGDILFFICTTPEYGYELWMSDGTNVGTRIVKDIFPGTGSSSPADLVNINGILFFRAMDETSGMELWKSDGTVEGTLKIKDIYPGVNTSNPHFLTNVNGTLFFVADDGTNGKELWKSDGTTPGTLLVKDIFQGIQTSNPEYLTSVGNMLYFAAWDGVNGEELWKSDGTSEGTLMVADIYGGSMHSFSYMSELENVNGTLYFSADDGTHGTELWKTDGTATGTVLVKDIYPGSANSTLNNLTNLDGILYFNANDGNNGQELWKSDGTAEGTMIVKDIRTGSGSSWPYSFTNVDGTLYFTANDGENGVELWKSDGTDLSTTIVKDIYPGSGSGFDFGPHYYFANYGGIIYFRANDALHGYELWKSDGTASGTVMIEDIKPGSGSSFSINYGFITNIAKTIYFTADDGENGYELWKTDGTVSGTGIVKEIYQANSSCCSGSSIFLTKFDGNVLFPANDGISGTELWISDGTEPGTEIVKDIRVGEGSSISFSYPDHSLAANGILYFRANDGVYGEELWKSDGTSEGTALIKDIAPGSGSSMGYPFYIKNINETIFFTAKNDLWKSDGTESGTLKVSPNGTAYTDHLTNVNGSLYYSSWNSASGSELWKSDGTPSGTVMIKDINPGSDWSFVYGQTNCTAGVNGTLYFSAKDGTHGMELWKSDGTASGTVMVKDICVGEGSGLSYQSEMIDVSGILYFIANNVTSGLELWRSDGTESGTYMVKDIFPGSASSDLAYLTNVNGEIYFVANNGANGLELWKSNGTETGTVMVKDLNPGQESGHPRDLVSFGKKAFFAAMGENDTEGLWESDGTESGTSPAFYGNLVVSSFPCFTVNTDNLYFIGSLDNKGFELLKYHSLSTNTEKEVRDPEVVIYPNPVNRFLNIKADFINLEARFTLYDQSGRKVFTKLVAKGLSTIDLGRFPEGIYLFSLESGSIFSRGKLIICK